MGACALSDGSCLPQAARFGRVRDESAIAIWRATPSWLGVDQKAELEFGGKLNAALGIDTAETELLPQTLFQSRASVRGRLTSRNLVPQILLACSGLAMKRMQALTLRLHRLTSPTITHYVPYMFPLGEIASVNPL